jgi:hypothetical protein
MGKQVKQRSGSRLRDVRLVEQYDVGFMEIEPPELLSDSVHQ